METIAEGVETFDELELVRMLGCSHVQGFIYAKPLGPQATLARLAEGLDAKAHGPRCARPVRQAVLRKIVLQHKADSYHATMRNLSSTGALVEGLWDVPPGTSFCIHLAQGVQVQGIARWCEENRMGVEFDVALERKPDGSIAVLDKPVTRQSADEQLAPATPQKGEAAA